MLDVRVKRITYRVEGICSFELVPVVDHHLPPFTAGAHIDIHLANGMTRSYSLHNRPGETRRYEIAVQREAAGRGGSKFIHDQIKAGQIISISRPRNNFELVEGAANTILIAGGIGITPIIAMALRLHELGQSFSLHYCGRTQDRLAFLEEAMTFSPLSDVQIHLDGGVPSNGLNVPRTLKAWTPGTLVYCCGPASLNAAVRTATLGWPSGTVHFESFAAPVHPSATPLPNTGSHFEVELSSTGQVILVPHHTSLLEALRDNAIAIESSCEAGTCGACKTRYLEGEPDHQDFVLTEEEQSEYIMPCVSRAKSKRLKLDL